MTRALILRGPAASFAVAGLLSLHALPGVNQSPVGCVVDASIAVLLLAFGESIVLTVLLAFIRLLHLPRQTGRWLHTCFQWVSRYMQQAWQMGKTGLNGLDMHPLLMALLLIAAGTVSPSDGVDSSRYMPAVDLLSRALVILLAGVGCFLLWMRWPGNQVSSPYLPEPQPKAETVDEESGVLETRV